MQLVITDNNHANNTCAVKETDNANHILCIYIYIYICWSKVLLNGKALLLASNADLCPVVPNPFA